MLGPGVWKTREKKKFHSIYIQLFWMFDYSNAFAHDSGTLFVAVCPG
jgi:hypothetical protein